MAIRIVVGVGRGVPAAGGGQGRGQQHRQQGSGPRAVEAGPAGRGTTHAVHCAPSPGRAQALCRAAPGAVWPEPRSAGRAACTRVSDARSARVATGPARAAPTPHCSGSAARSGPSATLTRKQPVPGRSRAGTSSTAAPRISTAASSRSVSRTPRMCRRTCRPAASSAERQAAAASRRHQPSAGRRGAGQRPAEQLTPPLPPARVQHPGVRLPVLLRHPEPVQLVAAAQAAHGDLVGHRDVQPVEQLPHALRGVLPVELHPGRRAPGAAALGRAAVGGGVQRSRQAASNASPRVSQSNGEGGAGERGRSSRAGSRVNEGSLVGVWVPLPWSLRRRYGTPPAQP